MDGNAPRPLLFLDVDGPLIPFGAGPEQYPDGYPTYPAPLAPPVSPMHRTRLGPQPAAVNPLLTRINPAHGPRLAALPCDLVWATTWMADANECVAPWLGLPELPFVSWPDPSDSDEAEWGAPHWKTRALVHWASGRDFLWVDDEITDADRTWVAAHHRGRALLHRVDHRHGLTDANFAALEEWLTHF
ncbi:HAD domain-containing protein [Streptomyces sp. NBC_00203]|uniref:HAD domain-containing protein n=1 Tax=Streptomyces sp. NBC_00203 TaxID=2975680 RepID=UPI00324F4ED4